MIKSCAIVAVKIRYQPRTFIRRRKGESNLSEAKLIFVLLFALGLSAGTAILPAKAQEADPQGHDQDDYDSYATMTREQWLAKVEANRLRLEQMRREGKSMLPPDPTEDEEAEEFSLSALQDQSLMPGDIVSTKRGLFRFIGKVGSPRSQTDFIPYSR